jgi:DMSO/TMAO reductase YedYZ molybdopterin-dependent catalytic subunit
MPNAHFYVRNHFQIPNLDAATWRLEVNGLVERPLTLSLSQLRAMRSDATVVTLECAGNGRSLFDPSVPGEQWGLGAVSTAEWTGVPLIEVIDRVGVKPSARSVVFRGADSGTVEGREGTTRFERSLEIDQVRDAAALLAFAMNGEALPVQHGYPLRLIVPGWYAVASVKWLTHIEVTSGPFDGYFQVDKYQVDNQPVTLQQVRSLIVEPGPDQAVDRGDVVIRGVAWSGAAPIARVDASVDGGQWQQATLIGERHRHRWQWWELATRFETAGVLGVRARATDLAGRVQPDRGPWNRLGYGNNAIQEARITVRS